MKPSNAIEDLLFDLEDRTPPALDDRVIRDVFAVMEDSPRISTDDARSGCFRFTWVSNRVSVAAAILLVAGLLLILWQILSGHTTTEKQTPPAQVAHQERQGVGISNEVSERIAQAQDHYELGNLGELLRLLLSSPPEAQAEIARMIGEIGDASAIGPLRSLADTWAGDSEENPFLAAIAQIQARLGEGVSEPNAKKANEPVSDETESGRLVDLAETGIAGQVIDTLTLEPISGARVSPNPSDPQAGTLSDSEGFFHLVGLSASTRQYLYVTAPQYASRRLIVQIIQDRVSDALQIKLSLGSSVVGIVKDSEGLGVAGARVETLPFTGPPVFTDADGTYRLDGLNPIVYQYSLGVTHPDYPGVSLSFNAAAVGGTTAQEVVLRLGVEIYGQVLNSWAEPLAEVPVVMLPSGNVQDSISVTTDDQGHFRFNNVREGDLALWVTHPTHALHVHKTHTGNDRALRVTIELQPPIPLRGRILDPTGQPLSDVRVSVREYNNVSNPAPRQYWTNREGRFVVANAPGHGQLLLVVYGDGKLSAEHLQLGRVLTEHTIVLSPSGRIYGLVLDDVSGEPISQFGVRLRSSQIAERTFGYQPSWDEEGRFFFSSGGYFDTNDENIPIGAGYCVTVMAEGYNRLTLDPVFVQPTSEDPNRMLFRMTRETALSGNVVDSDGAPIANAIVAIFSQTDRNKSPYWPRTMTDNMGVFVISGVGDRENNIQVTAPGFAPFAGRRTALSLSPELPMHIVMNEGGRVVGRVLGDGGEPLIGARLQVEQAIFGPLHLRRETQTDEEGAYEFIALPEYLMAVSLLNANGVAPIRKVVSVVAGQTHRVDFGGQYGRSIRGSVRRGPIPLPNVQIHVSMADGSSQTTVSDPRGIFFVPNVPQGPTRVNASWQADGQRGSEYRNLIISADRELDIDFGSGSISGRIPPSFQQLSNLRIKVYRWAEELSSIRDGRSEGCWKSHGSWRDSFEVQRDGRFVCSDLCAGRYYLVLTQDDRTLSVTDEQVLGESEHLQEMPWLPVGAGLDLRIVDAISGEPIPAAQFMIANNLGWQLLDRRHLPKRPDIAVLARRIVDEISWKGTPADRVMMITNEFEWEFADEGGGPEGQSAMVTDDQGLARFPELPAGQYKVFSRAKGYLWADSPDVQVTDVVTTPVTVALLHAATVEFRLSKRWQNVVHTDSVVIDCAITDIRTQKPVPMRYGPTVSKSHSLFLSVRGPKPKAALMYLPEGRYQIQYRLHPYYSEEGTIQSPIHSGSFLVEFDAREKQTLYIE